jgi:tetratricopeptide (TPR) repeat protein
MKHKLKLFMLLIFFLVVILSSFAVQAQTPQETLNQYVTDLQKNPNDTALREKIIRHVQGMKPKPVIPEDARRYFVKAVTMQKEAKNTKGFEIAVNAYNQPLLIAPWWPDAYYNLSIALESSGQYDKAVKALKLYLVTNPSASEVRAVQDKIYAIEAKKEMSQAQEIEKKGVEEENKGPRETGRDGPFIAYDNGTVLDTRTNLMWAAKDNGYDINWYNAKNYCENHRVGGYTDWRMPTLDDLAGLYDRSKTQWIGCVKNAPTIFLATDLIHLTCCCPWASETRGSEAANFAFNHSIGDGLFWDPKSRDIRARALPVGSAK